MLVSRWSELFTRACVPACAVMLQMAGCAESSSRNASPNGASGSGSGGAATGGAGGGGGIHSIAGQGGGSGSSGGDGAHGGTAAGRGGSPTAGDAGTGAGPSSGGDAGQSTQGGTAGDAGDAAGEGGSGMVGNGGQTPGGNCRLYASEYTYSSSGVFKTLSCTFDRPSLTMTCTSDAGDVTATTWATIEDAVRENRPLGAMRAEKTAETIAFTGSECRLTRDYQYDGSHHLTTIAITIDPDYPCSTNEAVYDAWDDAGRITHGVEHGIGEETCVDGDVAFTYDDALHTVTTVRSGGTDCLEYTTVVRYDADGLKLNAGVNPDMPTSTFQTLATAELCE